MHVGQSYEEARDWPPKLRSENTAIHWGLVVYESK